MDASTVHMHMHALCQTGCPPDVHLCARCPLPAARGDAAPAHTFASFGFSALFWVRCVQKPAARLAIHAWSSSMPSVHACSGPIPLLVECFVSLAAVTATLPAEASAGSATRRLPCHLANAVCHAAALRCRSRLQPSMQCSAGKAAFGLTPAAFNAGEAGFVPHAWASLGHVTLRRHDGCMHACTHAGAPIARWCRCRCHWHCQWC